MSERIEKAKELLERYGNDTARMLDGRKAFTCRCG